MAPVTRSSAPTTPSKNTNTSGLPTPTSTPRRAPHCRTCGQPRAGHPRSGCPNVESPAAPAEDYDSQLTDELESLRIVQPREGSASPSSARDAKAKSNRRLSVRFAVAPQESLASLSTSASEMVTKLLEPGMMGSDASEDDKEGILRWQKSLIPAASDTKPSSTLSRRMPGTLRTPTPSLASTQPLSSQESSFDTNKTVWLEDLIPKATRGPKPLGRTMSVEERSEFIGNLTKTSDVAPAMLFSVDTSELENVQQGARKVGFHVHALPGEQEGQTWLILGRDPKAVEFLALRFKEETKKKKQSAGTMRAAAGGALVGAVATWTGLAFS
ncbi:hypothetical protein BV22DRAFT_1027413 [Leucogyrophana mollusca]|uniref:Uncharacterized protein n=1 Tax=Leucogyrophana mollusca TaxID=85980 RepID=A0ACB8C041_9AGAM|nr:hypothetical protein BV22DRAFT_1027413 [Leucogyrophana mollusca]